MNKINNIEEKDSMGDFLWCHVRGFLFIGLAFLAMVSTMNMAVHYSKQSDKIHIENIKYCPQCGYDLTLSRG